MVDVTGRWQVDAIDAEPVSGPELELAADGRVTGSTGVNRLVGTYTVVDGHVSLGPVATTLMAGPEDAMRVEARLLALLSGPLHAEADAAGLALTGSDGTLHLVRADT